MDHFDEKRMILGDSIYFTGLALDVFSTRVLPAFYSSWVCLMYKHPYIQTSLTEGALCLSTYLENKPRAHIQHTKICVTANASHNN